MLQIGAEIANYEVVGVLGDGGMAVVYRVRHRVLLTEHALKVLEARWVRDDEVRQRFLLEARTQARLIHPHIVRVTDVVVEPGIAGAVMDLADGGDLGGHLKRRGPVDVGLAVRWTVELLDALAVVHAAGVVHRDVKPSNVLLRSGVDTGLIAQVTDFGVARQLTQDVTRHTRTIGTYAYMAPEQVLHPKSVDGRADLFSLGAVLHELLVGSPVFERDTDFATQSAVLHERPARLPEGARLRAPGLEAVVDRALAKDPEQRFESAAAFRDALLAAWCPLDWRSYAGSGWAAKLAMGEALAASERRRVEPARVDPSPTVAPQPAHPAASGSVEARLVVVGGALKEDVAHVDLRGTPGLTLSVGRGRDNEVCVRNDARVNRVHAKLQRTASGWRIADNNSANGTFVDGAPVADAPLRHGSVIVVGETRLRFELLAEGGASAGSTRSSSARGAGG